MTTGVTWHEFELAAPELAEPIRGQFERHLHHVLATLRLDGAPRVSGNEARFHGDHLWLGMMPGSRKRADLLRDPRFALHAAPIDTELAVGDAKVSGTAHEVDDLDAVREYLAAIGSTFEPEEASMFVARIDSAVLTRVAGQEMIVESWSPTRGLSTDRR